jgi:hypothetical protein
LPSQALLQRTHGQDEAHHVAAPLQAREETEAGTPTPIEAITADAVTPTLAMEEAVPTLEETYPGDNCRKGGSAVSQQGNAAYCMYVHCYL